MKFRMQSRGVDLRNSNTVARLRRCLPQIPRRFIGAAFLSLLVVIPVGRAQTLQVTYQATNLALLGMTDARDLNNQGQVAGNNSQHALLYSGGTITDLGTLGGTRSQATAINDSGQVVGSSEFQIGYPYSRAFRYSGGVMTDLGTLPGGYSSAAYGINSGGQVVGVSTWPYGSVSFLYSGGSMSNFWPYNYGHYSVGINGSGQIVLNVTAPYFLACYLYGPGVLVEVGRPGGLTGSSTGKAINEAGQIVGWFTTNNTEHAFLYSGGLLQDLGTLGGNWSQAYDINNNGQIVGTSRTSNGVTHPFLYSDGTMTDISSSPDLSITRFEWDTTPGVLKFSYTNATVPNESGSSWNPVAINDHGQILCSVGILLTPVTIPSTSAKLFWGNSTGQTIGSAIFTYSIAAGSKGGFPIQIPASSLQSRPPNATQVMLRIDPDNLVSEANEGNNSSALDITKPDLLPDTIAWNTNSGGLDFTYTVQPGTVAMGATSAKLFWAKGPTIADKISNTAIYMQSISANFSGQSSTNQVPSSSFTSLPTNATHVLLVLDPDSLIAESDENNNVASVGIVRPDIVATLLTRNPATGGLLFDYSVQPGTFGVGSTTVELFWANGSNLTNILSSTPIHVKTIPAGFSGESKSNQVAASGLANPPTNASHVLLVADRSNVVLESQEANNLLAFSIAPPVTLAFKRVDNGLLNVSANDAIDAPVVPFADRPEALANQAALGLGVVADGVTPVLLHLKRTKSIDQAASCQLELSIDGLVLNSVLEQRLRILSNGSWTAGGSTKIVNFLPGQVDSFAFIEGVPMEEALVASVDGELTATVKLKDQATLLDIQTYKIRRPPVVLVHGYNTDSGSWKPGFTNVLEALRPGFVVPVGYGSYLGFKGKVNNDLNTYRSLEENKDYLDLALQGSIENPETFPLRDWFFLRYDIVGHSQGGVLARMLCRKVASFEGTHFFSRKHPRGRFHRVITIGSPHNGSVIPYYLGKLDWTAYSALPAVLRLMGVLQPKFNPFGTQIRMLNAPNIDENARFHCIRTSIDYDGNFAPGLVAAGLGEERYGVLLPFGSDGVVDLESQGGGVGTKSTTITSKNIAHSGPLRTFISKFLIHQADNDTASATVASKVIELLDGPVSRFGRFYNPTGLSPARQTEIDAVVPYTLTADILTAVAFSKSLARYNFEAQPLPGHMPNGPITWMAEVLGSDGADQEGLNLEVNTNDTRQVIVSVDHSLVVGDVVLYASYLNTNGTLVLGIPKKVVSIPAGTKLEALEIRPNGVPLLLSNSIPVEVWGLYTNGVSSQLFTFGDAQFVFSSSAPSIVSVNTNGLVSAIGPGVADVQVIYQGLTNKASFTVLAPPIVTAQPVSQTVGGGSNVSFAVSVAGTAPFGYQWRRNGVSLNNQTNAVLSLSNVQLGDSGIYDVVVTNNYGINTSVEAALWVTPPPGTMYRAEGILATATSELASHGRYASNAVNGIYYDGNFWESLGVNEGFGVDRSPAITFDLRRVWALDKYIIWNGHEPPARVKRMVVEVSKDGNTFTALGETTLTTVSPSSETGLLDGVQARYVRFTILENGSGVVYPVIGAPAAWSLVAIDEVEFYGNLPPVPIALHSPVYATNGFSFSFDGNIGLIVNIERAVAPSGPWTNIGSAFVGTNSTGLFRDNNLPARPAFYRLRQP